MTSKPEPKKEENPGLSIKKSDDLSEWYTQVILKSELADYSPVSGCIIFRPWSYAIWERIQSLFDARIKATGHKNAYFPLFIPENLLTKESKHVAGFTPEVAWVTHAGEEKLSERLAIRPTSETIMYDSFSKWVRSHRDLPLLLNQWCSVVRMEFKHAKPFLRTREFLWQEGHTAHASKEDADKEVMQQLNEYVRLVTEDMAIALIAGKKTETEKFAGADYTTTMESLMPDGKALQMGTSHALGQNFSKAFDITFVDKDEERKHVWQTSWGLSTRTIGAMILTHGDDKGLVLPPNLAPLQAIIVPIIFKDSKEQVIAKAQEIKEHLSQAGIRVDIDAREEYSAGFKFSHWELKGVPLRIELGPKDLAKGSVMLAKRNTGEKIPCAIDAVVGTAQDTLSIIQKEMFEKSRAFLDQNIIDVKDKVHLKAAITDKKMARMPFCLDAECEKDINATCDGAGSRCIPFEDNKHAVSGHCANCGKGALAIVVFAKSY